MYNNLIIYSILFSGIWNLRIAFIPWIFAEGENYKGNCEILLHLVAYVKTIIDDRKFGGKTLNKKSGILSKNKPSQLY